MIDVSKKRRDFVANWDTVDVSLRWELLDLVKVPFCGLGYDVLHQEALGPSDRIVDMCKSVSYD